MRTAQQLLTGIAVTAVAGTALFVVQDSRDNSARNVAFVDARSTTELVDQVTRAVGGAFSVDPRKVKATQRRSAKVLTGAAVGQYDALYGPTLQAAASTGLSLVTSVRSVGVVWLKGDHAKLLVFADQSARTAQGQSTAGAAQLVLLAEHSTGAWQLTDIQVR